MKFIASKIHWIGVILLVGFTAAAAGLYFDAPSAPKKKSAPAKSSEIKAAAAETAPHAGCNHDHAATAKSEHGCGMSAEASEKADGCCGGKKEAAAMVLPAGHLPIEGYTVASDAHAGCAHGAEKPAEKTAVQP